ncbi:MAG: DNA primase [Candidatus Saganbacteria bacterium]|nr:DNA primase [Candidatus Saganbacteria bacterium]
MIPRELIEDIRNRSDIVQVISEYVPLKKRGRSYLGLCPFHSEKTASFTVSQEKQLFHCFGCGEGGNVFSFLMKIEGISFAEAAAELGEKLGVKVSQPLASSGVSTSEKERLYSTMLLAARFFRAAFEAEAGRPARDYLAGRGVNEAAAKTFGLGYAPHSWDSLFKHLIGRGVAPAVIERAGLVLARENQDGYYDRFRHRLIFPVCDLRGRVIAFSGRALDDSEPKYLNSPETPVYQKGETLFGLNLAREAVKKEKTAVLVEGNLDTVSVHQGGRLNVTAPLGTALTAAQCKLLGRFADTLVLAFDADAAGEAAAERSAEIIRSQGLKARIAVWTGAKDPDELIKKQGAGAFDQAVAQALPYLEFKLRRVLARFRLDEIEGRSQALRETARVLGGEPDDFARQEYARSVAARLKVEPETVLTEVKRQSYYDRGNEKDLRRVTEKPGSRRAAAEKQLLALAAAVPGIATELKRELTVQDFTGPEAGRIAAVLFNGALDESAELSHQVLARLTDEADQRYLTGALLGEQLGNPAELLRDCIAVIKNDGARRRIEALKQELKEAEQRRDGPKIRELIAALKNEIY